MLASILYIVASSFADTYIDGVIASFQQIQDNFSLPGLHFMNYLQIHSFVRNTFPG